ncbi:hypothetical protein, partial [Mycolicibacterium neoaurum]
MKLRTFFVGAGDCLLLSTPEGNNMLIDGGPTNNYFSRNVLPTLHTIQAMNQLLDVVVITHIDDDHIDGILELLSQYQLQQSQTRLGTGRSIPPIGTLWHNSWGGPSAKHAKAAAPQPAELPDARRGYINRRYAQEYAKSLIHAVVDLNYSVPQAIRAAQLITQGQQPIRRNHGFGGRPIALTHPAHATKLSPTTSLTVLGPTAAALEDLRNLFVKQSATSDQPRHTVATADWEAAALHQECTTLAGIPAEHQRASEQRQILTLATPVDPRDKLSEIGDERKVTVPNRASIIVLATERRPRSSADLSCLLTGDATAQAILHGLYHTDRLTETGPPFRCTILKVQHHGAENNYTWPFAERVLAEHYVVSANGQHRNPDPNVMRTMIEGRAAAAPAQPFTVWFTCTTQLAPDGSRTALAAGLGAATAAAQRVNHSHP